MSLSHFLQIAPPAFRPSCASRSGRLRRHFGRLLGMVGLGMLFGSVALANTATLTSSGTWTVPAGITSVDVLVVAGGGGGAGNAGGGGGAGGVVRNTAYSVTPGATISLTIA